MLSSDSTIRRITVSYENTSEDYIAFNRHFLSQSDRYRKQLAGNRFWYSVIMLAVMLLGLRVTDRDGDVLGQAIVSAIAAALFTVYYTIIARRHLNRLLVQAADEARNDGFIGPHELEIADVGLIERSPNGETRTAWHAVQRVQSTTEYTFIFISSTQAHVIPYRSVDSGALRVFLEGLARQAAPILLSRVESRT